jgi:2',3'-cyclic-nucleotide 2'-phosphodiesterase (5'-nucleotidase family)
MLKKTGIFILLFLLAFCACKTHYSVSNKEAQHQDLKSAGSSSKFDSVISPYKKQLSNEMGRQLVMCDGELTKNGNETTLGNFVCDAVKWAYDSLSKQTNTCVVLMNRGGLRSTISKGMVRVNSLFEVMPFDNELEIVEISGKDLEVIIDRVLEKKHAFSGMMIHADKNGEYAVTINGKGLEPNAKYSLLCADFVVSGGDGFTFGKNLLSEKNLGMKIRDAMIYYCMHLKYIGRTIIPYTDGRFEISK